MVLRLSFFAYIIHFIGINNRGFSVVTIYPIMA